MVTPIQNKWAVVKLHAGQVKRIPVRGVGQDPRSRWVFQRQQPGGGMVLAASLIQLTVVVALGLHSDSSMPVIGRLKQLDYKFHLKLHSKTISKTKT